MPTDTIIAPREPAVNPVWHRGPVPYSLHEIAELAFSTLEEETKDYTNIAQSARLLVGE